MQTCKSVSFYKYKANAGSRGYNALPFLIRSEIFLFPVVIFFILYVVSLLGVNVSRNVLHLYFGV
jgi:hypothetical protein